MSNWLESPPFGARRRAMAAGEQVLRRHAPAERMVYLLKGRVAIGLMDSGQMARRVMDCTGPAWLDPAAALHQLQHAADFLAETPGELLEVPATSMRQWLSGLPVGQRQMMLELAMANRQQTEAALGLMAKDAESRCAEWLLHHSEVTDSGGITVPLRERKRSIAAQLGIAPETLSRILRHLRESGVISQSGSVLNVIDPGGLQRLAGV